MNKKQIKIPSDIKRQLLPDEYVIYKLKPSWKIFIAPAVILLLIVLAFYFCKDGKSDIEVLFTILCAIGLGIFVSNFVILLSEYFKSLFLTNKRVIIYDFHKEINLNEIKDVTCKNTYYSVGRLFVFICCISPYNITFYCKDNESLIVRMANIDRKDYNKFKKLLTKECKKQGNNIS